LGTRGAQQPHPISEFVKEMVAKLFKFSRKVSGQIYPVPQRKKAIPPLPLFCQVLIGKGFVPMRYQEKQYRLLSCCEVCISLSMGGGSLCIGIDLFSNTPFIPFWVIGGFVAVFVVSFLYSFLVACFTSETSLVMSSSYHSPCIGRSRAAFPVVGSPSFVSAMNKVLDELEQKVPYAYRDLLDYLPCAVYAPEVLSPLGLQGRSDGLFAVDGTQYVNLRWLALHETGHNIYGKKYGDWSEQSANCYADEVAHLF
jgi:hypothetical protein